MARRRKSKPQYPTTVKQLAESFASGQDCGFALHDALLKSGHADLAGHFASKESARSCRPGEFCLAIDHILPGRLKPTKAKLIEGKADVTMKGLCCCLEKCGVAHVEVAYDGYGDSGQVETITFLDRNSKEVPDKQLPAEAGLEDLIEGHVCERLPGGWENNDGAYGTFSIDVLTRQGQLSHHDRYTATYDSTEDFEFS